MKSVFSAFMVLLLVAVSLPPACAGSMLQELISVKKCSCCADNKTEDCNVDKEHACDTNCRPCLKIAGDGLPMAEVRTTSVSQFLHLTFFAVQSQVIDFSEKDNQSPIWYTSTTSPPQALAHIPLRL